MSNNQRKVMESHGPFQVIRASDIKTGDYLPNIGRVMIVEEYSNCWIVRTENKKGATFGKYDTVTIRN